ncbi:MAG: type IVB secretion system protein IcmH/DotU [Gammaproteobacteria bacterium]
MEIKLPQQQSWLDLGESRMQSQLPAKLQPYYRSKAFVSQIGINPLIAAAAPIFFLVEKFQLLSQQPDLARLRENLIHEIKAFENQAQHHTYKSPFIIAAQTILCLWADEMVLSTRWGKDSYWQEFLLAHSRLLELPENASFFAILTHCMQDAEQYIDLLELCYLCLSLGFEGEYRYLERGYIQLAEIRDSLYHLILRQRGEISKQLEIKSQTVVTTERWLPRVLTQSLFITVSLITCISSYFLLNHQLTQTLNRIQPWTDVTLEANA